MPGPGGILGLPLPPSPHLRYDTIMIRGLPWQPESPRPRPAPVRCHPIPSCPISWLRGGDCAPFLHYVPPDSVRLDSLAAERVRYGLFVF